MSRQPPSQRIIDVDTVLKGTPATIMISIEDSDEEKGRLSQAEIDRIVEKDRAKDELKRRKVEAKSIERRLLQAEIDRMEKDRSELVNRWRCEDLAQDTVDYRAEGVFTRRSIEENNRLKNYCFTMKQAMQEQAAEPGLSDVVRKYREEGVKAWTWAMNEYQYNVTNIEDNEAKKQLETYCVFMRNELPLARTECQDKIEKAIWETLDWLHHYPLAHKDEILCQKAQLDSIIQQVTDDQLIDEVDEEMARLTQA